MLSLTPARHRPEEKTIEELPLRAFSTWSWRRYWPLAMFLVYLVFTVVAFAIGPIPYPIEAPRRLYVYLGAVHLALAAGYVVGMLLRPRPPYSIATWVPSVNTLTAVSSVLNIVLLIPATLFMTAGSVDLLSALSNPGHAYRRTALIAESTTNPVVYLILLVAPLLFLTAPLTLFYWRRLRVAPKSLGVAAIVVMWASTVMLGRNKGFADLVLLGLVFALAHAARGEWRSTHLRRGLLGFGLITLLFLLFFGLFTSSAAGRMPYSYATGYVNSIDGYMDYDNVLLKPFPVEVRPGVGHLYNYLTQGYYGLALSMELDFVWTRGLGNSYFLHMFEDRVLGTTFARSHCYPARVERASEYSMYASWHTIYPWLASDLTFPGTVVFVFLIGYALAVSWQETLIGRNPLSVAMFATLCLMIFYFPANNQALGFPVQFSATMGITLLWLLSRRQWFRE